MNSFKSVLILIDRRFNLHGTFQTKTFRRHAKFERQPIEYCLALVAVLAVVFVQLVDYLDWFDWKAAPHVEPAIVAVGLVEMKSVLEMHFGHKIHNIVLHPAQNTMPRWHKWFQFECSSYYTILKLHKIKYEIVLSIFLKQRKKCTSISNWNTVLVSILST